MTFNHIGTGRVYMDGKLIGTTSDVTVTVGECRPEPVLTHTPLHQQGPFELTMTIAGSAREYWTTRLFLIGGCRLPRGMQN